MVEYDCERGDCREPDGKPAYVFFKLNGRERVNCIRCYLEHECGMDPSDAADIEFNRRLA